MATDGPKIIDGDLAHDTYWGIMDLYDEGKEIGAIQEAYGVSRGYFDDFYYEIYITACALAFWEIGALTEEMRNEARWAVEKGAGVKYWSEEVGAQHGRARRRALDRLWAKISRPNPKPRKRKKYREVKNFHFREDDVLALQTKEGAYKVAICAKIKQYRGVCSYWLVPTTYSGAEVPTLGQVMNKELPGIWIGSGYNKKKTLSMQAGLDKLWAAFPEQDGEFFGLRIIAVTHKDLHKIKRHFQPIGKIRLQQGYKKVGSIHYDSELEELERSFESINQAPEILRAEKIPLKLLVDE